MTKEFCDICGRPIETYKDVSEFKVKRLRWSLHGNVCRKRLTVHNACWRELCKQIADTTIIYESMEDRQ